MNNTEVLAELKEINKNAKIVISLVELINQTYIHIDLDYITIMNENIRTVIRKTTKLISNI
jgi:hypothetical protein